MGAVSLFDVRTEPYTIVIGTAVLEDQTHDQCDTTELREQTGTHTPELISDKYAIQWREGSLSANGAAANYFQRQKMNLSLSLISYIKLTPTDQGLKCKT